ncbi:hypothetical protein [Pedobacter nototheniae]|uniref:hypothetical protein n=1 Tax=Pedobacter nototheniae TaxID=2488994 RepID=UPI001039F1D9|nr:hypothetical protein [Pedobacter nototheniae]
MPDTYTKQVFDYYQKRKKEDSLSIHLAAPTPGNLRDECLIVYEERGMVKETPALRSFFGSVDHAEDYIQKIRRFDIDKFRPVVNFLIEETKTTKDKNLKLIAWLIDFESRDRIPLNIPQPSKVDDGGVPLRPPLVMPTHSNGNSDTGRQTIKKEDAWKEEEKESEPESNISLNGEGNLGDANGGQPIPIGTTAQTLLPKNTVVIKPAKKTPKIIITCGVAIIIFIAACLTQFWKDKSKRLFNVNPLISIQTCMYWTGDHYEQIKCDQKGIAVLKIPFNKYVFENFEKITLPDTLTSNSLGKVWYSKQNNKVDFYTDSAAHPTDDNRRLLPLTQYMLNKNVSYKRYVLNIIYWSIGITFFILLFGGGAIYLGIVIRKGKQNKAAK